MGSVSLPGQPSSVFTKMPVLGTRSGRGVAQPAGHVCPRVRPSAARTRAAANATMPPRGPTRCPFGTARLSRRRYKRAAGIPGVDGLGPFRRRRRRPAGRRQQLVLAGAKSGETFFTERGSPRCGRAGDRIWLGRQRAGTGRQFGRVAARHLVNGCGHAVSNLPSFALIASTRLNCPSTPRATPHWRTRVTTWLVRTATSFAPAPTAASRRHRPVAGGASVIDGDGVSLTQLFGAASAVATTGQTATAQRAVAVAASVRCCCRCCR